MNPNPLMSQLDLGGVWHIAIFAGLSLGVVTWLKDLTALPRSLQILWAYVLIYALFILEWPALHFGPYTMAYQVEAGRVLAEAIFTPLCALLLFRHISKFITPFALFACACTWGHWNGFLHAPSFHAAFAALALPFLPLWAAVIVVVTILTHHGSTALMIMGAELFAVAVHYKRFRLWFAGAVPLLIGASYLHHHGMWFDGYDRVMHWQRYFEFWVKEPRWILLGVGPGSFTWTSAMMYDFKTPIFLQMHSDFLQILWELGVVGFGLSVWVTAQAIKRSWSSIRPLAGVFGSIAFAFTYYPLRYFPTALLIAWVFVYALFSCRADLHLIRQSSSSSQAK